MPYEKAPQGRSNKTKSQYIPIELSTDGAEIASQTVRLIYDVADNKKQKRSLISDLKFNRRQIKENKYAIIHDVLFGFIRRWQVREADIFLDVFNQVVGENYLYKEIKGEIGNLEALSSIIFKIERCCKEDREEDAKEFCKILIKYDTENRMNTDSLTLYIIASSIFQYRYIVEEIVRLFTAPNRPNKEKGLEELKEFLQNVIGKALEKNLSELIPKIKEYLAGEKVKEYLGGRELDLDFDGHKKGIDLRDISCGVYTAPSQVRKRKRQPSDPKSVGGSGEAKLILPNDLDSSAVDVLRMAKPKRTIWSFFSITTFFSQSRKTSEKGTHKAKECVAKSV